VLVGGDCVECNTVLIMRIVLQLVSIEMYLDDCVNILSLTSKNLSYIGLFIPLPLMTNHLVLHHFYDS